MREDQREALALLFVQQGAKSLDIDEKEKAFQLAPQSFRTLMRHARTNLELGIHQKDSEYLYAADQLFSQAAQVREVSPDVSDGISEGTLPWMWGTVWMEIGKHSGEAMEF